LSRVFLFYMVHPHKNEQPTNRRCRYYKRGEKENLKNSITSWWRKEASSRLRISRRLNTYYSIYVMFYSSRMFSTTLRWSIQLLSCENGRQESMPPRKAKAREDENNSISGCSLNIPVCLCIKNNSSSSNGQSN